MLEHDYLTKTLLFLDSSVPYQVYVTGQICNNIYELLNETVLIQGGMIIGESSRSHKMAYKFQQMKSTVQ